MLIQYLIFIQMQKICQCRAKKVLHLGTDWISPFLAWVLPQEESQQFHGDQRLQQNGVEYYHHHQEVWQGIWSLFDQTGARIEENYVRLGI